jgi:hypothetical protein
MARMERMVPFTIFHFVRGSTRDERLFENYEGKVNLGEVASQSPRLPVCGLPGAG